MPQQHLDLDRKSSPTRSETTPNARPQVVIHDVQSDRPQLRMPKRPRHGADEGEPEALVQPDSRRVR
ncbi:hypothetical protein ADL28_35290 [Streptomyces violaceusniger]|uniref:Uncharacterized protein n=1 Tax=Streptomyces violaceusniger TaxID=68280 RepID=A0A0X3VNM8_STRVO|nr:hypothetical protein ADL28_35290 [Streptomyces violaceusniger]